MGNVSCATYRPPYKKQVRKIYMEDLGGSVAASDFSRFRGLIQFARSCPDSLPGIGRYLLKQIKRDTSVFNTRRIEIAISAFEKLLSIVTLPLDSYSYFVIETISIMFDNITSPEFNLHGLKLLLAFVTNQQYKFENEVKKFYGTLQSFCVKKGLSSEEIRLGALNALREMMQVDKDDNVIEILEDFIPVIFDNITHSEFGPRRKSTTGIGEAAQSCFKVICLRTLSYTNVHQRGSRRCSSVSMSEILLDENDGMLQNFEVYERLMSSLITFLSEQEWHPLDFCTNVFLYFHRVTKYDLMKICMSLAAAMKKFPTGSGTRKLDIHDRIIRLLCRIFCEHASLADVSPSGSHLSAIREISKQTLNIVISSSEKGENWPEGKSPNLDKFAGHTLTCLEQLLKSLSYSDTLFLLTDLLDEWLKKAWIAESYYGVVLILRVAGYVSSWRERFPKNMSNPRVMKILVLALRFPSNVKLRLIKPLQKTVILLTSKLLRNILIPPIVPLCVPRGNEVETPAVTVGRISRSVYLDRTLKGRGQVEIADCFKLTYFEDFRIYMYVCLYNGFRSNNLCHEMASALNMLMIIVMSAAPQVDMRNILMLMNLLEDEVRNEVATQKTQELVRCCILAVLIQLARVILIYGTSQKNTEMVEKAMAAEDKLLNVARIRARQRDNNVKLIVSPDTGLLIIATQDRTDQSDEATELREPDNLCKIFENFNLVPTGEKLEEWLQYINEIHTRYSRGMSDEASAFTHISYTRFSTVTDISSSDAAEDFNKIDDDEPNFTKGFDNYETFQEFSEAFAFKHRKSESALEKLLSMKLHRDFPSPIQPWDFVIENELAKCPKLINNQITESPRRQKKIRDLFGSRRRGLVRNIPSEDQMQPSLMLGHNLDMLFNKFGLTELPLEEGLMSFELGNESIDILRSHQLTRGLRYMDGYEKTNIERFTEVRKNVQASAKEFFLRIKKNVQEKRHISRRNPFVIRESIRTLLQKGEQDMIDPVKGLALDDVHTTILSGELSEISENCPVNEYAPRNLEESLDDCSSYPTKVRNFNHAERLGRVRTITNSYIAPWKEYLDEDSDSNSLKCEPTKR